MKWWQPWKRERPFKFMELKRLMEMYVKAVENWDTESYTANNRLQNMNKVRLLAYELQKRTKEDGRGK